MVSRFLLISIILLLSYNFLQASPKAWVGKNPVSMGESFRFIIEVENEKDPREPDLTVLKDLKVLNRSVQNQTSIVGTKLSRKVIWTYELVSMRSGKIKIPELHAGKGFTESIMLDVLAVNQKNSPQEFLVFEADLDLEEVYPQQQVLLTLKIIRKGVQLENESITPLDIKNTRVRKVYQNSYRNIVKGQQQVVTEIRFSLFAENPGILTLPSIQYQGVVTSRRGQSRSLFQNSTGSRIFRKSPERTITVKPIPEDYQEWWLPTSGLELQEKWEPNPPQFRVGEPVTRTIIVHAKGVEAEQLPEWLNPDLDDMKIYSESPVLETKETATGLNALGKTNQALIPSKAGNFMIPGVRIQWWDVNNKTIQISKIPERQVTVLPLWDSDNPAKLVQIDEVSEMPLSVINIDEPGFKDLFWKYGTFVFLGLWLLTMGLWFARALFAKESSVLKKEEHERAGTKNLRQCVLKVENSIIKKDPALIRKSILEWAEMRWPEDPPRRLVDIGEKEIKLKESLLLMERHRYGEVGVEWNSEMLASQFQKVSQMHPEEGAQKNPKIKELYPESLKENQWN